MEFDIPLNKKKTKQQIKPIYNEPDIRVDIPMVDTNMKVRLITE